MFKVKILTIGKCKEQWLLQALCEYEKRLSNTISFEWCIVKNDEQLKTSLKKEKSYICLDSQGELFSSKEFSKWLFSTFEKENLQICIVIGGPEGLEKDLLAKANKVISFSKMTFTHQIIRLILAEQIYRAEQIQNNTAYHK